MKTHDTLRLYAEARTVHLERAIDERVDLAYRERSYDFDEDAAEKADARHLTLWGIVRVVAGGKYRIIEVNEPLMLGAWPTLLALIPGLWIAHILRRRPVVVSYAIENGEVSSWLASRLRLSPRVARSVVRRTGRALVSQLTRLAFGSDAARTTYERELGPISTTNKTFPAVEPACDCLGDAPVKAGVVFVGAFEARKGIPELMRAWDGIDPSLEVSLIIAGKGPLESEIEAWRPPSVRIIVDPPRIEIHRVLRDARVLVLLSQPAPRWREQIGLPIVEGLSHGCHIVTTPETGIAEWLLSHGHTVLPADAAPSDAASAISAAASFADWKVVVRDLPADSGRAAAWKWLRAASYEEPTQP